MAKTDKKTLRKVQVYTCGAEYLLESIFDVKNPKPSKKMDFKNLVIDFTLDEKIATLCKKLKMNYIACSPDEEKCAKFKRKLGFPDRYCTGMTYQ